MPKLYGKLPEFLKVLRDKGWAFACVKKGGTTAKTVAVYLAGIRDNDEVAAWLTLVATECSFWLEESIIFELRVVRSVRRKSKRNLMVTLGVLIV